MLRSLGRLFTRPHDQLTLPLDAAPRNPTELLARLRALGLSGIDRCRLTRNRAVMVSYRGRELRVHEGYLAAPPEVLAAIVTFVSGRTAASRRLARRRILAYPIARAPRARRPDAPHPDDAPLAKRLVEWHRRFNDRHFDGALKPIAVRVSRRMRARLGHYMSASPSGEAAEIVVSRRHSRQRGTRCCTRWCISGRPRPVPRSITAGCSGRRRVTLAWRPRRDERSRHCVRARTCRT